jgi:hypothetical protein
MTLCFWQHFNIFHNKKNNNKRYLVNLFHCVHCSVFLVNTVCVGEGGVYICLCMSECMCLSVYVSCICEGVYVCVCKCCVCMCVCVRACVSLHLHLRVVILLCSYLGAYKCMDGFLIPTHSHTKTQTHTHPHTKTHRHTRDLDSLSGDYRSSTVKLLKVSPLILAGWSLDNDE